MDKGCKRASFVMMSADLLELKDTHFSKFERLIMRILVEMKEVQQGIVSLNEKF